MKIKILRSVFGTLFLLSVTACTTLYSSNSTNDVSPPTYENALTTDAEALVRREPSDLLEVINAKPSESLRIHVMNVGNGNCVFAEAPNIQIVLVIDCGSTKNAEAMTALDVAGYFKSIIQSYNTPPDISVIISHPDKDHYNYIPTVLANYKTFNVYLGGLTNFTGFQKCFNYSVGRKQNTSMGDWILKQGKVIVGFPALRYNFGSGSAIIAANNIGLAPNLTECPAGNYTNTASAVLYLINGSSKVALLGDATNKTLTEVQRYLVANGFNASSLLTIASHHGANTHGSNTNWWTDVNSPQYVLYSAGTHQGYNHPKCEVLRNYGANQLSNTNKHCVTCYETAGPQSDSWISGYITKGNMTTLNSGINIFDLYTHSHTYKSQNNNLNSYCK